MFVVVVGCLFVFVFFFFWGGGIFVVVVVCYCCCCLFVVVVIAVCLFVCFCFGFKPQQQEIQFIQITGASTSNRMITVRVAERADAEFGDGGGVWGGGWGVWVGVHSLRTQKKEDKKTSFG